MSFNGTKGRIEMEINEAPYVSGSTYDQNNPDFNMTEKVTIQKLWKLPGLLQKAAMGVEIKSLLDGVFLGVGDDPLKTAAGPWTVLNPYLWVLLPTILLRQEH